MAGAFATDGLFCPGLRHHAENRPICSHLDQNDLNDFAGKGEDDLPSLTEGKMKDRRLKEERCEQVIDCISQTGKFS